MLTETFDRSEEIIRPELFYGEGERLYDIYLMMFS